MKHINPKFISKLEQILDNHFDSMGLKLLGLIPKITKEKRLILSTNRSSLTSLFLQALGTRDPNETEEDTLKLLLKITNGYIDGIKHRTKAKIIHNVNAYIQNQGDKPVVPKRIGEIIGGHLDSAKNYFKMVTVTESNNAVNVGTALQITKMAKEKGIGDPTVFFVVIHDDKLCDECKRIYLLPDKITPRVWKLSEVKSDYHKKGEQYPSLSGNHPYERCILTYLAPNWGFNKEGKVAFKGIGHDEWKIQRENYGLPEPIKPKKKKKK